MSETETGRKPGRPRVVKHGEGKDFGKVKGTRGGYRPGSGRKQLEIVKPESLKRRERRRQGKS
jgi:hypothetical protein